MSTASEETTAVGQLLDNQERLLAAARELDEALTYRFPRGQSKELPGLTLFTAWEKLREVLNG